MKLSDTQWRHARTWSRQRESIHLRIRAVQRQTAVTAYFSSKQLPPFAFADGLLSRAAIDLCTAKLMALSPAIVCAAVSADNPSSGLHIAWAEADGVWGFLEGRRRCVLFYQHSTGSGRRPRRTL